MRNGYLYINIGKIKNTYLIIIKSDFKNKSYFDEDVQNMNILQ